MDLWNVSEGHAIARQELINMRKIVDAAVAVVKNKEWAGVCDEDLDLETALKKAGEI